MPAPVSLLTSGYANCCVSDHCAGPSNTDNVRSYKYLTGLTTPYRRHEVNAQGFIFVVWLAEWYVYANVIL